MIGFTRKKAEIPIDHAAGIYMIAVSHINLLPEI